MRWAIALLVVVIVAGWTNGGAFGALVAGGAIALAVLFIAAYG